MLTPSINIVQSSFPEEKQGEISGLSRGVSNLGSSLGTVIAGAILVSDLASSNKNLPYILAMVSLPFASSQRSARRHPQSPKLERPGPGPPRACGGQETGVRSARQRSSPMSAKQ